MARYKRMCGYDVFFLTGVDEYGQKAEKAAVAQGITPQELADRMVPTFTDLWSILNVSNTGFVRTTGTDHKNVVQYLFEKIRNKGDIYLGQYEGWYCIPCETYFTELQAKDGTCPDCGRPLERLKEESYFFKMSSYGEPLLKHLEENRDFVMPDIRFNEVASFVKGGLRDLSISRTTFTWGVPVPGDARHVIYVWFDALDELPDGHRVSDRHGPIRAVLALRRAPHREGHPQVSRGLLAVIPHVCGPSTPPPRVRPRMVDG